MGPFCSAQQDILPLDPPHAPDCLPQQLLSYHAYSRPPFPDVVPLADWGPCRLCVGSATFQLEPIFRSCTAHVPSANGGTYRPQVGDAAHFNLGLPLFFATDRTMDLVDTCYGVDTNATPMVELKV
jgi:hypothetical protein